MGSRSQWLGRSCVRLRNAVMVCVVVGSGVLAGCAAPAVRPAAGPALSPISASFISASTGWLLAVPPCAAHGCRSLRMRETTDGGRHWLAVAAPPARVSSWPSVLFGDSPPEGPAGSVNSVLFASTSDGWAYGPGLWATHDGGGRWHRVGTGGMPVTGMAAGNGRVIAVFSRCPAGQPCRPQVYSSPAGADAWEPVAGTAGAGADTVIAGPTGYVTASLGGARPVLLAGPADGAAPRQARLIPCRLRELGGYVLPLAAAGSVLVLGCGGQPAVGNQVKRLYLSEDGGGTWRRLARLPFLGYLGAVSVTAAGTIFASGGRSDVYISRDGGRTWHTSPGLRRADSGDGLAAAMITSSEGFVLQASIYYKQIWFTYDAGRHWTPVTLR